jgi:hypothetical protein
LGRGLRIPQLGWAQGQLRFEQLSTLGAWFWLGTPNIDDLPKAAEPMLNMIEWWICLNMPPDEVAKICNRPPKSPTQVV